MYFIAHCQVSACVVEIFEELSFYAEDTKKISKNSNKYFNILKINYNPTHWQYSVKKNYITIFSPIGIGFISQPAKRHWGGFRWEVIKNWGYQMGSESVHLWPLSHGSDRESNTKGEYMNYLICLDMSGLNLEKSGKSERKHRRYLVEGGRDIWKKVFEWLEAPN